MRNAQPADQPSGNRISGKIVESTHSRNLTWAFSEMTAEITMLTQQQNVGQYYDRWMYEAINLVVDRAYPYGKAGNSCETQKIVQIRKVQYYDYRRRRVYDDATVGMKVTAGDFPYGSHGLREVLKDHVAGIYMAQTKDEKNCHLKLKHKICNVGTSVQISVPQISAIIRVELRFSRQTTHPIIDCIAVKGAAKLVIGYNVGTILLLWSLDLIATPPMTKFLGIQLGVVNGKEAVVVDDAPSQDGSAEGQLKDLLAFKTSSIAAPLTPNSYTDKTACRPNPGPLDVRQRRMGNQSDLPQGRSGKSCDYRRVYEVHEIKYYDTKNDWIAENAHITIKILEGNFPYGYGGLREVVMKAVAGIYKEQANDLKNCYTKKDTLLCNVGQLVRVGVPGVKAILTVQIKFDCVVVKEAALRVWDGLRADYASALHHNDLDRWVRCGEPTDISEEPILDPCILRVRPVIINGEYLLVVANDKFEVPLS
ncbi:hypothetical protein P154DRAFT_581291 [Amniculicola lignicola CBS 123094]|uniref:Uncharacterized protein n=1 Tax=Amniculicola lignicola CBS 123094 TaxID=1392246 RepID=A0A6A5WBI3_9PLEO|nr:hypothetical protein P154DRAFT_581291 [Amniculicola lignicola CBS 123094]